MFETTNFKGKKLDTFDNVEDMQTQLRYYDNAGPNVEVLETGYNMDLGFFILWDNIIKTQWGN